MIALARLHKPLAACLYTHEAPLEIFVPRDKTDNRKQKRHVPSFNLIVWCVSLIVSRRPLRKSLSIKTIPLFFLVVSYRLLGRRPLKIFNLATAPVFSRSSQRESYAAVEQGHVWS